MTQYCYALISNDTDNTVCFRRDAVLLCQMKHCYWEHSMLSSWHSIVMPNEALLLRTQYAFIMTQYCYALWSTVTQCTVGFHHDTVLLCPMKQCYWEHSMLSLSRSILSLMKHCYWKHSMLSTWHSIVMPCEVLLLRAQYAFVMVQAWYAQWSSVTENTVCFHLDTVLLCPVKHCYWEHSMLSSWHSIVMPCEALLLGTVCFHHDTVLLCPVKYFYWEQSAFIMTQVWYAQWSSVTESTVCFHHDKVLLCPVKYFDWEHSMLSSWQSIAMPSEARLLRTQYASFITQYCYALWSTFTKSTVCFHNDTGMVCPMKHCYWEHCMLSSWHSIVMPNEARLLRVQYASNITQFCYAQWSTVTENRVCFHLDTVLLCPMKQFYWEYSLV